MMRENGGDPGVLRRSQRRFADYQGAFRRHLAVFGVLVAAGTAAGAFAGTVEAPSYSATASVLVTPTGVTDPNPGRNRAPAAVDLDTEIQLALSRSVLAEAADAIGVPEPQLERNLTISVPPNSRVLDFAYVASEPRESARGANAAADAYLEQRREYAEGILAGQLKRKEAQAVEYREELRAATDRLAGLAWGTGGRLYVQSQIQLLIRQVSQTVERADELRMTVVTPGEILFTAVPPVNQVSGAPAGHLLEGLMLGVLAGCLAVTLLDRTRRTIHGVDELEGLLSPGMIACAPGSGRLGHRPEDLVTVLARELPTGGTVAVIPLDGSGDLAPALTVAAAAGRCRYRTVVAVWPPGTVQGLAEHPGMAEVLLEPGRDPLELAVVEDEVRVIGPGIARRLASNAGREGTRSAVRRIARSVDLAFFQVTANRPHVSAVSLASDVVLLVGQDRVTPRAEISRILQQLAGRRVVGVFLLPGPGAGATRTLRRRFGLAPASGPRSIAVSN